MSTDFCFFGNFTHSLDDKGRLALPSTFREELGRLSKRPDSVIALVYGDCLNLYPDEHWRKLIAGIEAATPDTFRRNQALRALADGGRILSLDKAGRVLIAPEQRSAAGLSREVKILGLVSKIQVWDLAGYEQQQKLKDKGVLDEIIKTGDNF